jgi:predicted ATP-binding protein involved in virulence
MYIKKIDIKNFRSFINKSIDFERQMTIIYDKKHSGKSTLMRALRISLSQYLQKLTLTNNHGKHFSVNYNKYDITRKYDDANNTDVLSSDKPIIETCFIPYMTTYSFVNNEYVNERLPNIVLTKKNKSVAYNEKFELYLKSVELMIRSSDISRKTSVLPVFAYYGENRFQDNYNGKVKTIFMYSNITDAYRDCLEDCVNMKEAFNWLCCFESNLKKDRVFEGTDKSFIDAVKKALPFILDLKIITDEDFELMLLIKNQEFQNPTWITYDMLECSYKSAVNIVFDLAYRCVKMNGFMKEKAVEYSTGIMLIDEYGLFMDEYVYNNFISWIINAFPRFQFIFTTSRPVLEKDNELNNIGYEIL